MSTPLCHIHVPQAPLKSLVNVLWYYEGYEVPHEKERLLPDGSISIVFNLQDDVTRLYDRDNPTAVSKLSGSIVCGAHSNYFIIDTAEQAQTVGVHFKPGGAFPLLGLPASEIRNQHISLEDIWGADAERLRNKMLEATTPAAKLSHLEQALLVKAHTFKRHAAVAFALERLCTSTNVANVIDQIGLSSRRFLELFSDQVGLSPKQYTRIMRFQSVIRHIAKPQPIDWTDLALTCGYFDQAHFNHDFRSFSGINPTTYLKHHTEHLNHVPMVD